MMLADTSVWIDHITRTDLFFARLLEEQQILLHPLVIGEIALGSLRNRETMLKQLELIPLADEATNEEVRVQIERHALYGSGIGYGDAHLLASARLSNALLWTHDKRLHAVAQNMGLARLH